MLVFVAALFCEISYTFLLSAANRQVFLRHPV